jgi:hypothetical protein
VSISEHVYRLLLRVYQRTFQRIYGPHMVQVFRDCYRETNRRSGIVGVMQLWIHTLGDLAATALAERLAEGLPMSSGTLIRWSGLAAMLGGLLWMLMPVLSPHISLLIAGATLLSLGAFTGLAARDAGRLGRIGKVGLVMAISGPILVLAFIPLIEWFHLWPLANLYFLSTRVLFVGVILLGIAMLRTHVVPRWTALLLMLGSLGVVLMPVIARAYTRLIDPWSNLSTLDGLITVVALLLGAGWIGLGYALWSGTREAAIQPPPAAGHVLG